MAERRHGDHLDGDWRTSVCAESGRSLRAHCRLHGGQCFAAVCAAIAAFALLPQVETFFGFSMVMGLFLIPLGALMAQSWQTAMFTAMAANFVPLLAPTNQMTYNTLQFYNTALSIVVGSGVAALSFRLLPPLSPAFRTGRLLALTLRDLRRLAIGALRVRAKIGKAACTAGSRCCPTRPSRCNARNS